MELILVCKLNNISFETTTKELNKYIKDLKVIEYKTIHNSTTEFITYANENRTKVFEANIHLNKDKTYNLSVYELKEIREIKVIKIDGNYFYTKINGTDSEVINYYNQYNLECDNKENIEVKEIHFLYNDGGFSGKMERKIIYNFEYDKKLNCYQY